MTIIVFRVLESIYIPSPIMQQMKGRTSCYNYRCTIDLCWETHSRLCQCFNIFRSGLKAVLERRGREDLFVTQTYWLA